MTLALRVQLLTGRYVATAYNDRSRAEWPPHPARVYSALVATHFSRPEPSEAERVALQWLEEQPAPSVTAPEASHRRVMTHFVPVNDTTVHSHPTKSFAKLEEARQKAQVVRDRDGKNNEVAKADKALAKARAKLAKDTRNVARPGSRAGNVASALGVVGATRVRQPRTFPSVTPEEDVFWLTWADADPPSEVRTSLAELARDVCRIGHSSSMVAVSLRDDAPEPTFVPSDMGELSLRVTGPGQFDALQREFDRHEGLEPRLLPALHQAYARTAPVRPEVPYSVFGDNWVILRRKAGPRLPSVRTAEIARAVRGALMKHGPDPVPSVILGRGGDGRPLEVAHLAIVPIPLIGGRHADGSILGVALVLPRECSAEDRRAIAQALLEWESAGGDPSSGSLRLTLGRAGVLELEREIGSPGLRTLRPWTWCGLERRGTLAGATRWATATPIALDRNPGQLRDRDPSRAAEAASQAEKSIADAAEHVGLPRPEVRVVPASPLRGGAKARRFPPFPGGGKTQRVLTHAFLEFPQAVRGPVILGAGRYRGLGLCRPLWEER